MRFYLDEKSITKAWALRKLGVREYRRVVKDTKRIHEQCPEYRNRYLVEDGVLTVLI